MNAEKITARNKEELIRRISASIPDEFPEGYAAFVAGKLIEEGKVIFTDETGK